MLSEAVTAIPNSVPEMRTIRDNWVCRNRSVQMTTADIATGITLGACERPVIVAVPVMGMMQMPLNEIVDMISVRYGLVAAARTMHMARLMASTAVIRRTGVRICR